MRDWIDLIEATSPSPGLLKRLAAIIPTNLAAHVTDEMMAEVFAIFREGHVAGNVIEVEPRNRVEALQAIEHGLNELSSLASGGTIRLYRGITVRQDWVELLRQPGQSLGTYWSYNENMTMSNLGFDDEEEDGQSLSYHHVTLCADAPLSSIDWERTVPEIVDGVECEIVLSERAPVHLLYIEPDLEGIAPNQMA